MFAKEIVQPRELSRETSNLTRCLFARLLDLAQFSAGTLGSYFGSLSLRDQLGRRRGGSMGYAPFPNKGMLLDSQREYTQAGLNPQWKTDVAFDLAAERLKQ